MTSTKTKGSFERKYEILSQQITTQKLPGKLCQDAPL